MQNAFLSLTAPGLIACGTDLANAIVQTQSATLNSAGASFSVPVTFNQFDPALGALNSITLDPDGSFAGTVGVENLSRVPDRAAGIIAGTISAATSVTALALSPALPPFTGPSQIFLTLTATSFPIAQGVQQEAVEETANAIGVVQLTYNFTPASATPEPGTMALRACGAIAVAWLGGGR